MELLKMEKKKVKGWVKCVMGKDKSGCGHTIGTTTCTLFSYRLHKFNNTNAPGPDIYQAFLPQLRALCPNGCVMLRRVALDTGSVNNFSNSFYDNLRTVREVIESNAKLWSDQRTHMLVQGFLGGRSGLRFNAEFGRAIVKMGNIENETSINLTVAFSGRHSGGIWQQLAHCPGNQINSFRCHRSIPAPLSGAGGQNTVTRFYGMQYHEDALARRNELFNVFRLKKSEGKKAYDYLERLFNGFDCTNIQIGKSVFELAGWAKGLNKLSFAQSRVGNVTSKRTLSIQARYSNDGGSNSRSAFIGGFVLGGVLVGTLGAIFAPHISKALAGTDKKELLKKLPNFIYDEEKALEKTRQKLAQKIAELNSAIDDV
ncbi:peroxidase N1-like protein, partial [Tanacetum coccineum]